jgi:ABC-type Fe3+-hydroxamate transport system substrate-binding protein
MKKFDLENKPQTELYRKKSTVELAFINEPFKVDTQEGEMVISPETVDDWDDGYYIAYPDDGSKSYSISPAYVRQNYEAV